MEEKLLEIVFKAIAEQKIESTGRNFTEKEVADIISVVAIMVGDPCPANSKELYIRFMEHLSLPEPLYAHLLTSVMASRAALKDCLSRSQIGKDTDELISKFMGNINLDDM